MPQVTFTDSSGQVVTSVDAPTGETILQIGLDAGIPLEHACGGNGFCTTCMCEINKGMEQLTPRNDREENMGVMDDPLRLTCQTRITGEGEVVVKVPEY